VLSTLHMAVGRDFYCDIGCDFGRDFGRAAMISAAIGLDFGHAAMILASILGAILVMLP
jgi:hypothetical protein